MKNTSKFNKAIWLIKTQLFLKPRFSKIDKRSIVFFPMQIDNPQAISIGKKIFISNNAWLAGGKDSNGKDTLIIDDYTRIGHFFHCIALHDVYIGKSVLIADKVFISDASHIYKDIDLPIFAKGMENLRSVSIGDGSWIGENVCILGANIGKHSVIGANSVVLQDIPDYCVAVGSPARVVRKYDFETKKWVTVE